MMPLYDLSKGDHHRVDWVYNYCYTCHQVSFQYIQVREVIKLKLFYGGVLKSISLRKDTAVQSYTIGCGAHIACVHRGKGPCRQFKQDICCDSVISCFILKLCPPVSCDAFQFLTLCNFPPFFYVHLCLACQSALYFVCVLTVVFVSRLALLPVSSSVPTQFCSQFLL